MRQKSIHIYEILASKHGFNSKKVTKEQVAGKTTYSFEKDGNIYSVIKEEYQSSGIAFYVEMNSKLVTDYLVLNEIESEAKKIYIPTDPDLKAAMYDMSRKALSKSIEKQYPPKTDI